MSPSRSELVLWTGGKHSGKTTTTAKLVKIVSSEGFNAAGVLAPSIYHKGTLLGFDVVDLRHKNYTPFARRKTNGVETGSFTFIADGLKLGNNALCVGNNETADLVIVDEFGSLELNGGGWRKSVDSLMAFSNVLKLLVVRQELADAVRQLYIDIPCVKLAANKPESIDEVIQILRNRRQSQRGRKCSSLTEC